MSCAACYQGTIHKGTPTGTVTKLHGLDTYVAEPASGRPPKGFVIILPDCYGWEFVNIRLMADSMAHKKDYRIYLPDFMDGSPAPLWMLESTKGIERNGTWWDSLCRPYHSYWLQAGLNRFLSTNRFELSFPRVKAFLEEMRQHEAANLPIGVTGYCWGGKQVLLLAQNHQIHGKSLIDAAFACHPSSVEFWGDIERIRVPLSFAIPGIDHTFTRERATETKERIENYPQPYKGELKIYEGHRHGFGTRADPVNDDGRGPEEAEDQALAWFEKHF